MKISETNKTKLINILDKLILKENNRTIANLDFSEITSKITKLKNEVEYLNITYNTINSIKNDIYYAYLANDSLLTYLTSIRKDRIEDIKILENDLENYENFLVNLEELEDAKNIIVTSTLV